MSTATLRAQEKALEAHPLFQISNDLEMIESPADLGYHPDSVLSVLDHFPVHSQHMTKSGMRGRDFVVIRCAPIDQYDLTHAKAECVFLRLNNGKWDLSKVGKPLSDEEFQSFSQLVKGSEVKMGDQQWKRI